MTHWVTEPTAMGTMPWPVIELPHVGALARMLDVDAGELEWFAETRGLQRHVGMPLRHYRWAVLPKRTGVRLVAAPKPRLKEIQRRLFAPRPDSNAAAPAGTWWCAGSIGANGARSTRRFGRL